MLTSVLELRKAKWGASHPDTLSSMHGLAATYRAAGQLDKALALAAQTWALEKSTLGEDHPITRAFMDNLARYNAFGKG